MTQAEFETLTERMIRFNRLHEQYERLSDYRSKLDKAGSKLAITLYDLDAGSELFAAPWRGSGLEPITDKEREAYIKVTQHMIGLRMKSLKREMDKV